MKTKNKKRAFLSLMIIAQFLTVTATPVFAEDGEEITSPATETQIHETPVEEEILQAVSVTPTLLATVHVRHGHTIVYEGTVEIPMGVDTIVLDNTGTGHAVSSTSALSALLIADAQSDAFRLSDLAYFSGFHSFLVNCIDLPNEGGNTCYNWQYVVDDVYPGVGIDDFHLEHGADIYVYFGVPHRVVLPITTTSVYHTFEAGAEQYDYRTNTWIPLPQATLGVTIPDPNNQWGQIEIVTSTVNQQGIASFTLPTARTYNIGIKETGYYPSVPLVVEPLHPNDVLFHIRHEDTVVFEGPWRLPADGDVAVTDNIGTERFVSSTSILGTFSQLDQATDAFTITDIAYYPEFNAFLLNCISFTQHSSPACYNWQYVVNDTSPGFGIDQYRLSGGEDVYFYFGTPHRLQLSRSSMQVTESVTVTTERYDYRDNVWKPLTGVVVGATQPNPTGSWEPVVISTTTVDGNGQATLQLPEGTYGIGIKEDGYYPTVPLTVTAHQEGNNGGGSTAIHQSVHTETAIQFLRQKQTSTGSILNAPLYSDWTALAFGAYTGTNPGTEALRAYLLTDPTPGTLTTDYERRAMALQALGINPYTGTQTNYIQKITERFTHGQFGEVDLINDDVFALFPLLNAGYTAADPMIVSSTKHILSKQEGNGGWIGVDITAATIQALSLVQSIDGVPAALARAKAYLRGEQQMTGGWNNSSDSTSWAMQAIAALGETEAEWVKDGKTPGDFLATKQMADGGLEEQTVPEGTRAWSTAYAIPGTLGKTWDMILVNVEKPGQSLPLSSSGPSSLEPLPAPATTTTFLATTTPVIIISTTTENLVPIPTEDISVPTPIPLVVPSPRRAIAGVRINSNEETFVSSTEVVETVTTSETTVPLPEITPEINAETASGPSPMKIAFATATAIAGGTGLYLVWRFLKGLV
ncbi:MAG TPA: hypothetical protein VEA18_03205 [Candidatus Kapabacteria bacterium]|nr:hypothetical protein [Candidatus Kapabacteria bacterium]